MASKDSNRGGVLTALFSGVRQRYRVLLAAGALAGLAFLGSQAWRYARVQMREDPRYQVTAASIETPPTPPWIRTDIRLEALRDAGLRGDLSVLDLPEQLQKRLADAFAFHPWVESVGAITKRPPNRIAIELTYRRPLAAVEVNSGEGALFAVDANGVRLPSRDLTDTELRYLPRIRGIGSTTLRGEVWRDARVLGAVSLVSALGQKWSQFDLIDVIPSRSTEVHGDLRYHVFQLVSSGGTRIDWGAAPNATPPGESVFAAKLARLEQFVSQNGGLGTTFNTPAAINVRNGLQVTQRTAQAPTEKSDGEEAVLKK